MGNKHDPWMQACISGKGMGAFRATIAPLPVEQRQPRVYRNVTVGEACVRIEFVSGGATQSEYRVRLLSGDWPEQMALFHACDGGTVFGGKVRYSFSDPNFAEVTVWTD